MGMEVSQIDPAGTLSLLHAVSLEKYKYFCLVICVNESCIYNESDT